MVNQYEDESAKSMGSVESDASSESSIEQIFGSNANGRAMSRKESFKSTSQKPRHKHENWVYDEEFSTEFEKNYEDLQKI